MIDKREYRLIAILAICQLLWVSAGAVILTLSGLVGHHLASNKSLATLPFALMCVVDAAFSVPASSLMLRIGRRRGFLLGALFGCLSGAVAALAVIWGSFVLFCFGVALWGLFTAFAQFYRYAAADGVKPELRSTAISAVVASGIIAVFVGPEVVVLTGDLIETAQYAGSFAAQAGLCVLAILVTLLFRETQTARGEEEQGAALSSIDWQPSIVAGLINGAVSYSVMVFVMTASPLAAVHSGHSVSDAADIIQWHLLGMYAPSLVTGWLIYRFGEVRIMFLGIGILIVSVLAALQGTSFYHYGMALLFLGAGWNLMYVSSSVLLSSPEDPRIRAKVQGIGELINNSTVAVAAFSAGSVFVFSGWAAVNMIVLPLLGISLLATVRYALVDRARRSEV